MAQAAGGSQDEKAVQVPLNDLVSDGGCPVMASPDAMPSDTLYYWDYLHLDYLLNAQTPRSEEAGELVHDEYFFIVVHQTYELWFKQILLELDSVMSIMSQERIAGRELGTVLSRLRRINQIQRLMVSQMDVLETMTPLDFLDFRSLLLPASGFQSVQFRLIENKFGLLERDRLHIEGHNYVATLREDHGQQVILSEQTPSLFDHIETWLARLPFVHTDSYDFAAEYEKAASEMHAVGRAKIEEHPNLDDDARRKQLDAFESSVRRFGAVFDKESWAQDVRDGREAVLLRGVHGSALPQPLPRRAAAAGPLPDPRGPHRHRRDPHALEAAARARWPTGCWGGSPALRGAGTRISTRRPSGTRLSRTFSMWPPTSCRVQNGQPCRARSSAVPTGCIGRRRY